MQKSQVHILSCLKSYLLVPHPALLTICVLDWLNVFVTSLCYSHVLSPFIISHIRSIANPLQIHCKSIANPLPIHCKIHCHAPSQIMPRTLSDPSQIHCNPLQIHYHDHATHPLRSISDPLQIHCKSIANRFRFRMDV